MLKTQFYVFTSKKTKDKIRPEKAKKQKLKVAKNPKKEKKTCSACRKSVASWP